jgi:hypothetical protein
MEAHRRFVLHDVMVRRALSLLDPMPYNIEPQT